MIRGTALENISSGDRIEGFLDENTKSLVIRKARPKPTEREKTCDEIIEQIRKIPFSTIFIAEMEAIILQIKSK